MKRKVVKRAFACRWTFPTTRLKQRDLTIQSAEVLTNICKTALRDLESVGMPPPGVIAEEFCFEDLLTDPKGAVARLFSRLPGMGSVIPPYVDAYGKSHVLGWRNGFGANFTGGGMRGKEGRGGGVDHRFCAPLLRKTWWGLWHLHMLLVRFFPTVPKLRTSADFPDTLARAWVS